VIFALTGLAMAVARGLYSPNPAAENEAPEMHPKVPIPDPRLVQLESSFPLYVQLMQIAFYGGLVFLMVGLPVFIWLWIRICHDIHQIQKASWATYFLIRGQHEPAEAHQPRVINSAFGR
jgi:hypothetical protein